MVKKNKKKLDIFNSFNTNKFISGIALLILNLFSKYVQLNLSNTQEEFIRNSITREFLIFTISFIATHDIIVSIILTASFIILSRTIFDENSKLCIIPNKYKEIGKLIDKNKDNKISKEELDNARKLLQNNNKRNNY